MSDETLFHLALEKSAAERPAFLQQACAGDGALQQRVEALLRSHDTPDSFLVGSEENPEATTDSSSRQMAKAEGPGREDEESTCRSSSAEGPGSRIGPYKLLQQIGEGGMGTVYMAEQAQPVRRTVALKLIKAGMDSRQVLARFGAERQALALMDHPNIAKVFDAGTTDTGRPYFVMELVKGIPITKFCDERRLTTRERLELAIPVCQAVQHAHQKGIIHRDLKPSNVLIALYDGKPVPKVIDFGVAKATGQRLTDQTLYTEFGAVVGTLEYMSPEQAELNQLDIDTRSDIYSLGVLLYELLTGSTPLDRKRLKQGAILEMLRVIREEESPRPSIRLSTTEELPSIAACRNIEPRKLSGLMRGELDWIVMKALEKDRNRRYETANGLAADLRRYLDDEPVQACPPSAWYRFGKFTRRNKGPVLASAVVLLVLIGGIIGTTWGFVRAERARRSEAEQRELAQGNERKALAAVAAEKQAKETALAREAETKAVLDFVENKVFAAARPQGEAGGLGYDVTLHRAVEAALPFVDNSFTNQPLIEARLRMTLGGSFLYLGKAQIAAEQFQRARTIFTKQLGPDHPNTLRSMNNLAKSYSDLGRHADALKLNEETLTLMKAKLGPDHPDTLISMSNLANSYEALGRHADALKLHQETLAVWKRKFGPDHPNTLGSMTGLANSYSHFGRHAEALKLREETLALHEAKLGPDHPDTLISMSNLANSYADLGRHADALKLREETLALRKAMLGPDHPDTLASMYNLASSYGDLGRHADALKLREETLALYKAKLGADHPQTLRSMGNLAASYFYLGRLADARKIGEETLALMKAKLGPDHPVTLDYMYDLTVSYAALGRHASALKFREETLALRKAKLGPDHPDTLWSMWGVAESLAKLDRSAEAVPIIDEFVQRAAGKFVDPRLISGVIDLRLRHFAKAKDPAGCRATAEMWEKLKRSDAGSLYNAACFRAVTAAILRAGDQAEASAKAAAAEADRAMGWLKQAVAAGYNDAAHMAKDKDLDPLRDREDFKKLVAELQARNGKGKKN